MKVVVGLRNPGPDYAGTRHNIGFEVIESLARSHGGHLKRGPSRVRAELAEIRVEDDRLLLVAPLSFMNECGGSVRSALAYHKTEITGMVVIHDDIDLAFSRLRLQNGGGTGGHNGLRSIERSLGTRDFARLKIGVGRPPQSIDPADYVLSRFSKTERSEMDLVITDAAGVVERWVIDPARAQEQAARRAR